MEYKDQLRKDVEDARRNLEEAEKRLSDASFEFNLQIVLEDYPGYSEFKNLRKADDVYEAETFEATYHPINDSISLNADLCEILKRMPVKVIAILVDLSKKTLRVRFQKL